MHWGLLALIFFVSVAVGAVGSRKPRARTPDDFN